VIYRGAYDFIPEAALEDFVPQNVVPPFTEGVSQPKQATNAGAIDS
jgi:hypothetical protein